MHDVNSQTNGPDGRQRAISRSTISIWNIAYFHIFCFSTALSKSPANPDNQLPAMRHCKSDTIDTLEN